MKTQKTIKRSFPFTIRSTEGGEGNTLCGHAALFNELSEDLGGFREVIERNAFAKTLRDGADVRALINHNPDKVLGRTKSGTLSLSEDEAGLYSEVLLPDTTYANDLKESIKRGDIDQMSFSFNIVKDNWKSGIHRVKEVKLNDVSFVTYPAFTNTEAYLRALEENDINISTLLEALEDPEIEVSQKIISDTINKLEGFMLVSENIEVEVEKEDTEDTEDNEQDEASRNEGSGEVSEHSLDEYKGHTSSLLRKLRLKTIHLRSTNYEGTEL